LIIRIVCVVKKFRQLPMPQTVQPNVVESTTIIGVPNFGGAPVYGTPANNPIIINR